MLVENAFRNEHPIPFAERNALSVYHYVARASDHNVHFLRAGMIVPGGRFSRFEYRQPSHDMLGTNQLLVDEPKDFATETGRVEPDPDFFSVFERTKNPDLCHDASCVDSERKRLSGDAQIGTLDDRVGT
jgi:hypothetical protein